MSMSTFTTMATGKDAKILAPYTPRFLDVVDSGEVSGMGMDAMVFQIIYNVGLPILSSLVR
jgi:hypothetical protein